MKAFGSDSEICDATHNNPAMEDAISVGGYPSPLPQPEDDPLRPATLTQIAALSEQARELEKLAMSFTNEAGGKEYFVVFFDSLADLLLKLDLIESNGVKEVHDAR